MIFLPMPLPWFVSTAMVCVRTNAIKLVERH